MPLCRPLPCGGFIPLSPAKLRERVRNILSFYYSGMIDKKQPAVNADAEIRAKFKKILAFRGKV